MISIPFKVVIGFYLTILSYSSSPVKAGVAVFVTPQLPAAQDGTAEDAEGRADDMRKREVSRVF